MGGKEESFYARMDRMGGEKGEGRRGLRRRQEI
jgi:hypothetical protein